MSELKITQEKVTAAFSEANDCPKAISILTALFGKQKPDYTDSVSYTHLTLPTIA